MSRLCFLVDSLPLPAGPDRGSAAARTWRLAEQCVAQGDEVTLLHVGAPDGASADALKTEAERIGAWYLSLATQPPPFAVSLFPSAPIHTQAHQVATVLREYEYDTCIAIDCAAAATIALLGRTTGLWLRRTQFVVMADALPREMARLHEGQPPPAGREDIIHDYFERRTLADADLVVSHDAAVLETLTRDGFVRTERARFLDGTNESIARLVEVGPQSDTSPSSAHPRSPEADDGGRGPRKESTAVTQTSPRGTAATTIKVSVCVPYHEQPAFLQEALDSLAMQSRPPYEVIVMDDGSKSSAAVEAFAAAEQRYTSRGWKFLHQANTGPATARNRMAALATGDAVLFCDADNRFRPEMIATLADVLARTDADVVTCAFQAFRTPGEHDSDDRGYVFSPLGPCIELALVENVLGDTNFLVRREVFQALGGFPERNRAASEDWEFLLQLVRAGRRLETVPAILFDYRLAQGSHARRHTELASAAAAIAPVLASAEPAWQRLWPHIVAAIRNPQVPQLQHKLESERLQWQAELARVQQAFDGFRREMAARIDRLELDRDLLRVALRRSQWERFMQKSTLDAALDAKRAADAARAAEADRVAELTRQLDELRRSREHEIAVREAKIARMRATWSWQATAPFRALRRSLLDPLRRRPDAPPAKPLPSATAGVNTMPRFAFDRPAYWDAAPASGAIAGWCFFGDGAPARAVRLQIDGAEITGESGLVRTDVAKAHGAGDDAAPCGFEFRYHLPVDRDHSVRLEAQAPDGTWHLLREDTLHTTNQPREVHDYTAWVENFSTLTPERTAALRNQIAALGPEQRPFISVLMPVHNTAERWLTRAIESVREQVYENWELCIADDASSAPEVRAVLERFQAADSRIRVTFRAQNGHISAASNSALELVRGDFVALLDHDDELSPDALAEVALLLARHPDADLVYSDEDKIDEDGRRRTPYFKPDYLPDLLLGQNCLSHLSVYRTALVRTVGGFRVGYEGSQDWDLALRVIDQTMPDRIRHLPKVLYHWRAISGSTAVEVSAKHYSVDAARRALLDHFARRGLRVELRPVPGDHWQIVYPLPDPPPLVSIIIPTRNAGRLLRTCVGSIFARTDYPRFEILIVNNGSDDAETLDLLAQFGREPEVRVLDYDAPFNYSAINNWAARQAKGTVLCFLNNDIEVITGRWLDEMVGHALRPEIGAVGAMLYYPNNTIQHAGVILGLGGVANHAFLNYPHGTDGYMNRARLAQNYSAVTAACLVVTRAVFERVGGFNEADLAVAFNDVDLCLRIRAAGYQNVWTPFAELYHHESATRADDNAPNQQPRFVREIEYMRRTWGDLLDRDPAYNPNLSVDLLGWRLAWPPRL